jgi:hypothetical protein
MCPTWCPSEHQLTPALSPIWGPRPMPRHPEEVVYSSTVSAIKSARSRKYMRCFKYTEIYDTDIFLKLFQALRIGLGMFLNVKHQNGRYQHPLAAWNFLSYSEIMYI